MRAAILAALLLAGCVQVPGHDHRGTELHLDCDACRTAIRRDVIQGSGLQDLLRTHEAAINQNREGIAWLASSSSR